MRADFRRQAATLLPQVWRSTKLLPEFRQNAEMFAAVLQNKALRNRQLVQDSVARITRLMWQHATDPAAANVLAPVSQDPAHTDR